MMYFLQIIYILLLKISYTPMNLCYAKQNMNFSKFVMPYITSKTKILTEDNRKAKPSNTTETKRKIYENKLQSRC